MPIGEALVGGARQPCGAGLPPTEFPGNNRGAYRNYPRTLGPIGDCRSSRIDRFSCEPPHNGEWRMQNCRRRPKFAVQHSTFRFARPKNFKFTAIGGRQTGAICRQSRCAAVGRNQRRGTVFFFISASIPGSSRIVLSCSRALMAGTSYGCSFRGRRLAAGAEVRAPFLPSRCGPGARSTRGQR